MSLASNTWNSPESSEYRSCVQALLGVLSESETQQYYEKVYNVLTCHVCDNDSSYVYGHLQNLKHSTAKPSTPIGAAAWEGSLECLL